MIMIMMNEDIKKEIGAILDEFMEAVTPEKPQWFKTTKPLPDGWYGWRHRIKKRKHLISCIQVTDGRIDWGRIDWGEGCLYPEDDFSKGEWFKIKFPD